MDAQLSCFLDLRYPCQQFRIGTRRGHLLSWSSFLLESWRGERQALSLSNEGNPQGIDFECCLRLLTILVSFGEKFFVILLECIAEQSRNAHGDDFALFVNNGFAWAVTACFCEDYPS